MERAQGRSSFFRRERWGAAEGQMVRADLVREDSGAAGAGRKARDRSRGSWRWIARRCGAGCEIGGWQPRQGRRAARARSIRTSSSSSGRGPEVGWNGVVLHRELGGAGIQRQLSAGGSGCLKPRRDRRRLAGKPRR